MRYNLNLVLLFDTANKGKEDILLKATVYQPKGKKQKKHIGVKYDKKD
ncbi:hypothetical protein ACFSRY_05425 [Pontibacter locisalis]|uniref:Uncharacterized protein n=1 Tax=Pontibacter locisalis TaxID=1719035 RepID=A0ABW5IIR9_9BACT